MFDVSSGVEEVEHVVVLLFVDMVKLFLASEADLAGGLRDSVDILLWHTCSGVVAVEPSFDCLVAWYFDTNPVFSLSC